MYQSDSNKPSSRALGQKFKKPEYQDEKNRLIKLGITMINCMKNGVPVDEEMVRPFDIIDFCSLTTYSVDELYYIIKDDISIDDQRVYRKFQQFNSNNNRINQRVIENYNLTFGNRTITDEEKWYIYSMLESCGFPLNYALFNAAAFRIHNGTLTINDVKPKTLTLNKD